MNVENGPNQFRETFARAFLHVMRKIESALRNQNGNNINENGTNDDSQKDLDRALKWFLILPQAFLRKATRGRRAGMGQIKKRFDLIQTEKFDEIINHLLNDKKLLKGKGK